MASIAGTGHTAGARWTLTALLQRLQPAVRHRRALRATDTAALPAAAPTRRVRPKRHYPPQRDSFIEHSSMAREMFRL